MWAVDRAVRHSLVFACVIATWVSPEIVTADEASTVRATIVHIDGDDVVIDAGGDALGGQHTLTVYRAIEVRHPVTRRVLRDRFVIGALRVTQVGQSLSVTRIEDTPDHPLRVGDIVEVAAGAANTSAQTPAGTPASTSETQTATTNTLSEEQQVVRYWQATLSQAPEMRIRYYRHFVESFPSSRYRAAVDAEIAYLTQNIASTRTAAAPSTDATARTQTAAAARAPTTPPRPAVSILSPRTAAEGRDVEIALHVRAEPPVRNLLLHARPLEADHFESFVMSIDARGHARVVVPASIVRAPGFAYFVQAVDDAGDTVNVHAGATAPSIVTVTPSASAPPTSEPTTRVRFSSELVSFDGTSGRDYFFVNEGDFLYRVRFHALYGVRLGYGNYRGQGGTVEELDELGLDPKPAGFTYGFVETELALHSLFGLALRATVGLGRPDDPQRQRNAITGGFQLRARIGTAEGTHLVLAGELLPEIGQRAYIGLHWEAIENLPMQAEVVVTDQPVNSNELAVRLIYEVGYRFSDRVSVAVRPSYQLRNIHHAGPGVGFAATFDW